jgi:hypothetical protein
MTSSAVTTLTVNEENEKDIIFSRPNDNSGEAVEDTKEEGQDPPDESTKLERWNHPRINMYRYLTTLLCFINMGMNDAAYGVSLPRTWRGRANTPRGFNTLCKNHLLFSFDCCF